MEIARAYIKQSIRPSVWQDYRELAKSLTETVGKTEPETLQYEAFGNEDTQEVVWLESYLKPTSFDIHLYNEATRELKRKMSKHGFGI